MKEIEGQVASGLTGVRLLTYNTDWGHSLVTSQGLCEANACCYGAKLDAHERGVGVPETVHTLRVGMGPFVG